ncbi:MAG: AAA family ATPase, partial [Spirochaetales bacterium]|nr:AAA family ATPase [Spirochaetales bacterium]
NLAHAFALTGKRVLLIDLDDQKNSTSAIETVTPPTRSPLSAFSHLGK